MRRLRSGLLAGSVLFLLAADAAADDVIYTYDALGRLVRVEYAGGSRVNYNYDAAGNRISVVYGGTNVPPVANPDVMSTTTRKPKPANPRVNDTDADHDTLIISAADAVTAKGGTVIINNQETVTYTPEANFPAGASDTDTFHYSIYDGHGHTQSSIVTVTVTNRAPVPLPDTVSTPFETMLEFPPLGNDGDPDGDTLSITVPGATQTTLPSGAKLQRNGAKIRYWPPAGFSGTDSFGYTIADGHGNTATATETVSVGLPNRPPVAGPDRGGIFINLPPPVTPSVDVFPLENDSDPDNDVLTVIGVTQPAGVPGATATFTGNLVTYHYNQSVNQEMEKSDSFTYTVSDGHGHTAQGTVTIHISASYGGT